MIFAPKRAARLPRCVVRPQSRRSVTSSPCKSVPVLDSWDLDTFRERAFKPATPHMLPFDASQLPPACNKWFLHNSNAALDLSQSRPKVSELRTAFWSEHEETLMPLELTISPPGKSIYSAVSAFQRTNAPLKLLLSYLGHPVSPSSSSLKGQHSIYLAQCPLPSLPESVRSDLPTPEVVLKAGNGDIYDSSLWLGRPPTYTPLHRDPNPNFFLQLAGSKIVRLFPPKVGDAMFEAAQELLQGKSGSSAIRGEEMMQGVEKEMFHHIVWANDEKWKGTVEKYGQEAILGLGEALFIPKGWWHSVKGVGEGVVASANW